MKWVLNTYQTAQDWEVERIIEVCRATGYEGIEFLQDFKQKHGLEAAAPDEMVRAAGDEHLVGKAFFATHDEHLSVAEIARRIVRTMGSGSLTHVPWPDERRRIEIDNVRISSERLRALTGWKPRYSFDQGLEKTKAILVRTAPSLP